MLKQTDLVGALVYYDGAHNDSRMNVSIATTAALYGATVVNHMEVTKLLKDESGRLTGAMVRDLIGREEKGKGKEQEDIEVRAKVIVNCTGPFTDGIRKLDDPDCKEIVAPASGVHVILPGYYSPGKMGLIDPSTSDGRVIFFLPWQGNTIAGTTDEPSPVQQDPLPDEKSIQWILDEIRRYLSPDINVRRGDVLAAWSGLRPLVKDPKAKNTESLVRNHLVDISESGLLTCAGGKWTTYRQMAEECVDAAIRHFGLQTRPVTNAPRVSGTEAVDDGAHLDGSCQTHKVRLVGAHGFSRTLFIHLIQHFGIETEVAKHLTESYGDRAWTVAALCRPTEQRFPARGERISQLYPFVDGEVRYAVRHEYAQTAADVLARRTRLAFLNAQASLEALPKVIDLMTQELGWDRKRQDLEWRQSKFPCSFVFLPFSFVFLPFSFVFLPFSFVFLPFSFVFLPFSFVFLPFSFSPVLQRFQRQQRLTKIQSPLAVAFLESMGLPKPMLRATRKQVQQGRLDLSTSLEYNMYSRHEKPPPDDDG
jgi:glycerol-3-phosphate dehydrogenase